MAKVFTIISQQTPQMATIASVASGTTSSIAAGVPTYQVDTASVWTNGYVAVGVDATGTTTGASNLRRFTGIAKSNSTETASVAGTVELWEPFPGVVYNGYAKSAAAADTAAEILALKGKRVIFDLTTGDWTIDTAAADAQINCVTLLGTGNPTLSTLNFVYKATGTYLDFSVSA